MNRNRAITISLVAITVLALSLSAPVAAQGPVAAVSITPSEITWTSLAENDGAILTISGPDGFYLQQAYDAGAVPAFGSTDGAGNTRPDGVYTYELVLIPADVEYLKVDETQRGLTKDATEALVQSGSFAVLGGSFVTQDETEGTATERTVTKKSTEEGTNSISSENVSAQDILHLDDVIIDGSLCVGFDCVNGESFGFDTIRLKENNLRIKFQITANDSSNGGANKFSIDDIDGGKTPFTIEAGAPSHSLYVEDYGRVGLGTSTPAVELHIATGDTPTVRLDQDGSSGWAAQRWDVAGNETNFFIRDVTNGSKLPFRIRPNAPTNSIYIENDGQIGMGTSSPAYSVELETTGENAFYAADRTDGATAKFGALTNKTVFGSVTNHPVR
ncbi:MAG: hypothetical protein ACYTEQ_07990, partial [Planctomycetota bacterium]